MRNTALIFAALMLLALTGAKTRANSDCVSGGMLAQMAAAAHRAAPDRSQAEETKLLTPVARALHSDAREEILAGIVHFAWTHRGDDANPTIRDFEVSTQYERACKAPR
jgi:hypothetical protein